MLQRNYRIVVPTRDSARWLGSFHNGYRRLGIEPIYLFDTRSRDCTREILQDLGAEVINVEPRYDRVEAMLSATLAIPSAEWVVRFDDDELPSAGLIKWLDESLGAVVEPCLAISRRDLFVRGGQLCFSRMEHFYFLQGDPTFLDPQWRGFRPRDVRFNDAIHSPGFAVEVFGTVPQSAYFAHFDWIVRSLQQRQAKIRRYESQSPGSGWPFAHFYLPELHHPQASRWTPIETDEFNPLITELCPVTAG